MPPPRDVGQDRAMADHGVGRAIILAAGQGVRLQPYTESRPKCLLEVGGRTILEHQVGALRSRGIDRITVVTGFCGAMIRSLLAERVEYIENSEYKETSSMYSLWMAREEAREGFLVLNGDVLFHAGILAALLRSPYPDALAVDYDAHLEEEEMKVRVRGDRVAALGKSLTDGDGENVGMIKFGAEGSRLLFATMKKLLEQGLRRKMVPYAVSAIAPDHHIAAVPVGGLPWIEIDFTEDYRRAREVVYPAILKAERPEAPSGETSAATPREEP